MQLELIKFCASNCVPFRGPPLKRPLSTGSFGCIGPLIVLPLPVVSLIIAFLQNMPAQHLPVKGDSEPLFSGMSPRGTC